jgi:hypothetical protein
MPVGIVEVIDAVDFASGFGLKSKPEDENNCNPGEAGWLGLHQVRIVRYDPD